jgi:hypothetical protein
MADDKHYIGGDNYILDDLSGFKIRRSKTRVIPGGQTGGLAVSPLRWEPQQPQDFVIGVRDDQTVELARPRQVNQFVIVGTSVAAPSARGSFVVTVQDSVGFAAFNLVQIMLDSGVNFRTTIQSIAGKVWTLVSPLPFSVGSLYGDPIENSVLRLSTNATAGTFVLDTADGILDTNVLA